VAAERKSGDSRQSKQNLALLCLAIFIIGTGEELWMRFLPKYLEALGATALFIGLFDALTRFSHQPLGKSRPSWHN
jgi:hypothetical protein